MVGRGGGAPGEVGGKPGSQLFGESGNKGFWNWGMSMPPPHPPQFWREGGRKASFWTTWLP